MLIKNSSKYKRLYRKYEIEYYSENSKCSIYPDIAAKRKNEWIDKKISVDLKRI